MQTMIKIKYWIQIELNCNYFNKENYLFINNKFIIEA